MAHRVSSFNPNLMSDLLGGFVKVTDAGREYKTSRSTLDRRREAARLGGNAKLHRVFRLRTKDGEVFDQPSKGQVAQLTKDGRVPEWFVSRNWLAKEFGKRADERNEETPGQGALHELGESSALLTAVRQQYEERIKDLKEQLTAEREQKKELLEYAQADKQMFASAAHQLTQVLALPAITAAAKNRTKETVPATMEEVGPTDRKATDRSGQAAEHPTAKKRGRSFWEFFKRAR